MRGPQPRFVDSCILDNYLPVNIRRAFDLERRLKGCPDTPRAHPKRVLNPLIPALEKR